MNELFPPKIVGQPSVLRPFEIADVETILVGSANFSSDVQPNGPPDRSVIEKRVAPSGFIVEGRLDLGIEVNGRLVGDVTVLKKPMHKLPESVHLLGIVLNEKHDRGLGYGTDAVSSLTDWLLDPIKAKKVQAGTTQTNNAMRRTLDRIGYKNEGP